MFIQIEDSSRKFDSTRTTDEGADLWINTNQIVTIQKSTKGYQISFTNGDILHTNNNLDSFVSTLK